MDINKDSLTNSNLHFNDKEAVPSAKSLQHPDFDHRKVPTDSSHDNVRANVPKAADKSCDRSYTLSDSDLNLDVVPRRAFYDNRVILGKKRDIVVVLTELLDTDATEKSILACEVDGTPSSKIKVTREQTWWVRKHYPGYTHATSYVFCWGYPAEVIRHNATVRLVYQSTNQMGDCRTRVTAEKPLQIMKPVRSNKDHSVIVCTAAYNRPPYFDHWLRYQRSIGVDKVHLSVEASFAENATAVYPYLKEALRTGFVTMEVWNNYVGDKIYYFSHTVKLQECVLRYTGVYDYAFVCDVDEFFIPLVPGKKNIHYYAEKFFRDERISAASVQWRRFLCRPEQSKMEGLTDGNLTSIVSQRNQSEVKWEDNTKTLHRLSAVGLVGTHKQNSLLTHYRGSQVKNTVAYMGHIRPNKNC